MIIAKKNGAIIRHTRLFDICELSLSMRAKDRLELWRASHSTPEQSLLRGYLSSSPCLTLEYEEEILAILGVSKTDANTGCVWLLGSEGIKQIPKTFVRLSKEIIHFFLQIFPKLWNYVDAEYEEAVKWLSLCGARIHRPQPYGAEGELFHYFTFGENNG